MFLYGTNAGILRSWLMAYDVVDEAMLIFPRLGGHLDKLHREREGAG